MRKDIVLVALINFLVPIILLYAFFSLTDYINNGFFSVIYAIILFAITFMIYAVKFNRLEASAVISIKVISWFTLLISSVYLIFILLLLINVI